MPAPTEQSLFPQPTLMLKSFCDASGGLYQNLRDFPGGQPALFFSDSFCFPTIPLFFEVFYDLIAVLNLFLFLPPFFFLGYVTPVTS